MLENANNPENKFVRYQYAETRLEPIWECLVSILKDPENVIPKLEEYTFKNSSAEKANEKIAQCEKQIKSLLEQRARITRAFMFKSLPEKECEQHLKECNENIEAMENQKAKFEQVLIKRDERKDRGVVLKKLYEQIKTRLENVSYEDKQYILRLFIERINLFPKKNYAEVFFRFPVSTRVMSDKHIEPVSQQDNMRLILHIKTLSQHERSRDLLVANPGMYKGTTTNKKGS
ncbi:MAG: hypothetical protein WC893_00830 [Candidatus Paceibacterota bacterium]|jgi:hypothetical protein